MPHNNGCAGEVADFRGVGVTNRVDRLEVDNQRSPCQALVYNSSLLTHQKEQRKPDEDARPSAGMLAVDVLAERLN